MFSYVPALAADAASVSLDLIINSNIDTYYFERDLRRLHCRFKTYSATCPAPFIAPGLIVTPEIRRQSEIYLPISEIRRIFYRLYRYSLTYPPIFSSSPFFNALSWADVFVDLPPDFQVSTNPARLLEGLLSDQGLLTEFLFHSFLPRRFYGGFGRYSEQEEFIRKWLSKREVPDGTRLSCLDAACGTGEDTYGLVNLMIGAGFSSEEIQIEGWTLDPLEVWVAAHQRFPHDKQREAAFRIETSQLFELGFQNSLTFRCADLTESDLKQFLPDKGTTGIAQFDLILCNGLLGGPIINQADRLERVTANLVSLLAPGGVLLAANSFHDGWQAKYGNNDLKALFSGMGLKGINAGDGVGGLKH